MTAVVHKAYETPVNPSGQMWKEVPRPSLIESDSPYRLGI